MNTSRGMRLRRALVGMLAASMLLVAVPGTVSAAAWFTIINNTDASHWSWPGLAQTFVAAGGALDSVVLTLHRAPTDTGTYRVEIRTTSSGVPTGHQAGSTGVVLAAQALNASALSTNPAAPSTVNVNFTHPAILASQQTVAVVLIRGTNSGIAWHASTPGGADPYPDGKGFFCVIGNCWTDAGAGGAVDFMLSAGGSSSLMMSQPRASVVAPNAPTRAASFTYRTYFDKPVTGLAAGDFSKSGTATGCSIGTPTTSDGGSVWAMKVSGCSQGTLRLTLKANSVRSAIPGESTVTGPAVATPGPATLRIDRTKPSNGAPKSGFTTGKALSGSKLPVRVSWSTGTDRGGAGVAKYEVSRSTNGGSTWTSLGTTQKVRLDVLASSSGSLRYRLRAIDWAGNKASWRYGPTLAPRLIQQSSSSVAYGGSWTTLTDAAYSGGTARQSDSSGAAARYTFTARAIAVVMSADPALGSVKVYVNGTLKKTVDTSSFATGDRVVIYQQVFATRDTRTIRIVSSNGVKPNVVLDAFGRL